MKFHFKINKIEVYSKSRLVQIINKNIQYNIVNFYKNIDAKINNQNLIFKNKLNFSQIDEIKKIKTYKTFKINVWRNHQFELCSKLLKIFLNNLGISCKLNLSAYDNSFALNNFKKSDLEIIWLDPFFAKKIKNKLNWIKNLFKRISNKTKNKIIFCSWFNASFDKKLKLLFNKFNNIHYFNLRIEAKKKKFKLLNSSHAQKIQYATPIRLESLTYISRLLAFDYISALANINIKAIFFDLDNTLHEGVLAEDGITNLKLNKNHKKLHEMIIQLKKNGFFILLVTKNDKEDVLKLLNSNFYKLKKKHFTFIEANWLPKSNNIKKIIKNLNIHESNCLFIDDNISELTEVLKKLTYINILLSDPIGEKTYENLKNYYGLKKFYKTKEDNLRSNDIIFNSRRKTLIHSNKNDNNYFKSLKTEIKIFKNNINQIKRLFDLSNKTNQFNTNFLRLNIQQLREMIRNKNYDVLSVSLKDKYSDSGIIMLIIIEKIINDAHIIEIAMSCRAMGRKLENTIIFSALSKSKIFAEAKNCFLYYKSGPRNQPTTNWLKYSLKVKNIKKYDNKIKVRKNMLLQKQNKFININVNEY